MFAQHGLKPELNDECTLLRFVLHTYLQANVTVIVSGTRFRILDVARVASAVLKRTDKPAMNVIVNFPFFWSPSKVLKSVVGEDALHAKDWDLIDARLRGRARTPFAFLHELGVQLRALATEQHVDTDKLRGLRRAEQVSELVRQAVEAVSSGDTSVSVELELARKHNPRAYDETLALVTQQLYHPHKPAPARDSVRFGLIPAKGRPGLLPIRASHELDDLKLPPHPLEPFFLTQTLGYLRTNKFPLFQPLLSALQVLRPLGADVSAHVTGKFLDLLVMEAMRDTWRGKSVHDLLAALGLLGALQNLEKPKRGRGIPKFPIDLRFLPGGDVIVGKQKHKNDSHSLDVYLADLVQAQHQMVCFRSSFRDVLHPRSLFALVVFVC